MPAAPKPADGHAGARRCAALLGIAVCAETNVASLQQEARKVDLVFNFTDPFGKHRLNLNCQVKSGDSYKAKSSNADRIKLRGIDDDTLAAFRENVGLITWVPPAPDRAVYWFICRPFTNKTEIVIPRKTQKVSPALRYVLAREFAQRQAGLAVPVQAVGKFAGNAEVMKVARKVYRDSAFRQLSNTVLGTIHLTRTAWRHITRAGKPAALRLLSLRALPHLRRIIEAKPSSHTVKQPSIRQMGNRLVETRIILCWYRNALFMDNRSFTVMLRVKEEISYPHLWDQFPLSEELVERKATLLSWWARPEK